MSKATPLVGCLNINHNEVDCEAAGLAVDKSCASCWVQRVPHWSQAQARAVVERDMVYEGEGFDPVEEQISAGLAFLAQLWEDRHQL